MNKVNKEVNSRITYRPDINDYWTTKPENNQGDCEEYVLVKRKELIKRGIPEGALRLVFAYSLNVNDSHLLLAVSTNKGDFILDNNSNDLLLPSQTNYLYIGIQNLSNPRQFLYIKN